MGKVEDLDKVRRARGKTASGGAASSSEPGKSRRSGTRLRCPICKAPTVEKYRPFCSRRCAEVDLGRWIGGDYRIAGIPANALNLEEESGEDPD